MNSEVKKIYYGTLTIDQETMFLAATEKGLVWAGSFHEGLDDMKTWLSKKLSTVTFEENLSFIEPYKNQFIEYFHGERDTFDFPLDLYGTPFQLSVWDALQKIPYGKTATYSAIADRIGNPKSIRAVGTAIGRNPILIAVPCHRVINKDGRLGGFRGGIPLKSRLLQIEKQ
ncbi:methylated-DNA--[protein]-cysteine S-methyltransferase [Oceanobacillus sp. CAU 1775]